MTTYPVQVKRRSIRNLFAVSAVAAVAAMTFTPKAFAAKEDGCSGTAFNVSASVSGGGITAFNLPGGNGVRVDTAQYAEGVVPPYYDSLIAKLICHGADRVEAMDKMQRALSQFVVQGIHTTIPLHQKIFADAEFRAGQFDTKFMERFFERQKES